MAAELAKHVGIEGDITYSTNNGLVEIVPMGVDKATGIAEIAGPLGITECRLGRVRRHAQRRADAAAGRPRGGDG